MKLKLRSNRFFFQVVATTTILLFLLCLLFLYTLQKNAAASSTDKFNNAEAQRLSTIQSSVESIWEQWVSVSASLASMTLPYDEVSISNNYWARTILDKAINSHIMSNTYIRNIDIAVKGISLSPSAVQYDTLLATISYTNLYTDNIPEWPYNFDMVTNLRDLNYDTVSITISSHYLSKKLFLYDSAEHLDYLLTQNGTILLTNNRGQYFQNIETLYPKINEILSATQSNSFLPYQEYYVLCSEPDQYGFRVMSLTPKQIYQEGVRTSLTQTLLSALILFPTAIVIALILSARFYRPIKITVDLLQTYIHDDIHNYENEIAFIRENIARYFTREDETNTAIRKTMVTLQNAQSAVLQHQINSHFLFNTLENIKAISIGELGVDNEIENSIVLLNSLIREGVSQKNAFISLAQEIHLSRCYLALMQLRFPDVRTDWDIQLNPAELVVFKFTLQPILENCFVHAFKDQAASNKTVSIRIYAEGNVLIIRVRDNGVGIAPAAMDTLDHLLNLDASSEDQNHVGVNNIHRRITSVFGESYGLRVFSLAPKGTCVEIRYPMITADEIPH